MRENLAIRRVHALSQMTRGVTLKQQVDIRKMREEVWEPGTH
jgi:hypothetical protein